MRTDPASPLRFESRRSFLKKSLVMTAGIGAAGIGASAADNGRARTGDAVPWYRRAYRWGQTNITEVDPTRYDIAWWRQHWKRTRVQGVVVNAGGIFAYYPSRFPLHRRPDALGDRDLFGELSRAAHEDGVFVFSRMDSNRAHEPLYRAHPDWFAVDADGKPYRAGEMYVFCVNGPYYEEWIPGIMREIAERYRPEGFTDNSWAGLGRGSICHCENCRTKFRAKSGLDMPREKNWNDRAYREWIQWSYARRIEIWDLNNRVATEAGGSDCIWVGMTSGSISGQSQSFRDYKAICERAKMIMLDHQARSDASGFQHNGEAGKLIHGLLGWDKLIPESMAMYQAGRPTFRVASKPEPEARMWMLEGFAGGIQPWWHHVSAYHEDRRMYRTAEPILRWHEANQQFLVNREPIASVGVVWSQRNTDFYGRDNADDLVELPWRGVTSALIRARISYLPVHVDHVGRDAAKFSLLILPNVAAMSDAQVASVRRFVEAGGSLIATGETSRCDEWGDARPDFALADLLGAHVTSGEPATADAAKRRWASETAHSYLRLAPELRAHVYGPKANEPVPSGERHPVLRGFDETDILPFGGVLEPLRVDSDAQVLATFVPSFPIYPPETAWMREPRTSIPAIIVRELSNGARVGFLPADLDRRFSRDNLPDHGNLLANLVRWTARDRIPLSVEGPGLIDCHLYQQREKLIVHFVNLTSAATWRAPIHELIAVGPLRVRIDLPKGVKAHRARSLVSTAKLGVRTSAKAVEFDLPRVLDHEVIVIG